MPKPRSLVVAASRQSAAFILLLALAFSLQPSAFSQLTVGRLAFSSGSPVAFTGIGVTNGTCTGPNFQSNVAWFCTSACGLGAPRITYLTFAGDTTNSMTVYACTNVSYITNSGISGTNQLWLDCTGFASNDVIVVRSVATDTYQRCFVTNNFNVIPVPNTNNALQIWPSAAFATTNGDIVYKMTPTSFLIGTVGGATTNYPNYGTVCGREGVPLLLDLVYSNTAAIKSAVGDYIRRN